jgi:aspartyl-tRNA(Asn)/glutamyl-tRNA(Gln) amidotransferase subunit C
MTGNERSQRLTRVCSTLLAACYNWQQSQQGLREGTMALTLDEVRKVALLARLELEPDELERQGRHLNDILIQFEALQALDVAGIEPATHSVPLFNVFREDRVIPSLSREEALANAPESRDGCFIVPRILEG